MGRINRGLSPIIPASFLFILWEGLNVVCPLLFFIFFFSIILSPIIFFSGLSPIVFLT